MSGPEDEEYDEEFEAALGDGDDDDFDCHLMPDGQCMKAGSEECDWECPWRNSEFFAGSAAWNKKHSKKRKP